MQISSEPYSLQTLNGVGNGEYVGRTNLSEVWDDPFRVAENIFQHSPRNYSPMGAGCWLGREDLSGQFARSTPFLNFNGSPFDVSSNSSVLTGDLGRIELNSWRSGVNDWTVDMLQKSLKNLCLENVGGTLVSLAKDQYGCRMLQRQMEGIAETRFNELFVELIDYVVELMIDPFGNYVVQKLVEVCNAEQRTRILLMITMNDFQLVGICLNMHGTRAIQKLLDHLTLQEQITLFMSAIRPGVVALTKDMNGHHVIQHCLKHFSTEHIQYLLSEVAENCISIATDKSGCCVLQQCVDYSYGELKKYLIAEIVSNSLLLATDRYGNYVVQHLLNLKIPSVTASLLGQLQGSYMTLSYDKYGSNVVEKCLSESGQEFSAQIIMELLRNQNVSMLLVDPFGNYVIQTALSVSKDYVHSGLLNLIRLNWPKMRSNPYGRKILGWFQKRKAKNC